MDISSRDLDDLIEIVFGASEGEKETYKINPKDLTPSEIKFKDYSLDNVFDKTPIQLTEPLIIDWPDYELKKIQFKRQGSTHRTTIGIVEYPDATTIDSMTHPINVQGIFMQLLSQLVLEKRTEHILLPIINIDVKGSDITNPKVRPYINPDKYYSVSITERFRKLMTLDEFLQQREITSHILKDIVYQVIDTTYHIATVYPKYCNSLLKPKYISCYTKTNESPIIKMDVFYGAVIPGIIDNDYVKPTKALDNVLEFLEELNTRYQVNVDKDLRDFIKRAGTVASLQKLRDDPYFKKSQSRIEPQKKSPPTDIAMSNKAKKNQSRHVKPKVYRGQRQLYQPETAHSLARALGQSLNDYHPQMDPSYFQAPHQQTQMAHALGQAIPDQRLMQQMYQPQMQEQQNQYQHDPNYLRYMAAMQQQENQTPFDPTFQTMQGGGQKPFFFK